MSFSPETLTELVRRHLPELPAPPSFAPIRTGKFNTSFWVRAGGAEYVLRIAPPRDAVFLFYEREMMRQEPAIHALVRARTSVPVARILAFDDSRSLIDRHYLLMERLAGQPLTEVGRINTNHVLRQVGRCLAEVHGLHEDRYGYLGAHHPMEPQRRWVDAFLIMWNKLIDDIVGVGYYDEQESARMRRLLDDRIKLFDRPVPASLLHMDIWHQNLLVDEAGRLSGIVDWDRALWGDPEIEFAVLDYCGISQPAFWEGYGQRRDWSAEARVRNVFYFLYELQKYIVIRAGRNHDPASARSYKRQVMEIVETALARSAR